MSKQQRFEGAFAARAARRMPGVLIAIAALLPLASSQAATFTVTTTADSEPGSLRQAIVDANATSVGSDGNHTIAFDIAGTGVQTIRPATPLPKITAATVIDGYTQPGSSRNTLASGSNAVLLIELDGSLAGANADGIAIGQNDCCGYTPPLTIRGLVINRFSGRGLVATGRSGCDPALVGCRAQLTVVGSRIGTDANGTAAAGNGIGIDIGLNAVGYIGGEIPGVQAPSRPPVGDRNLISGNLGAGVRIDAPTANPGSAYNCYAQIYGGDIGTDASGTQPLGNGGNGVEVGEFGAVRLLYSRVSASGANGIDITRSAALPNQFSLTSVVDQTTVGGAQASLGNQGHGLHFSGSTGASVNATIQHNGGAGIRVESPARVDFSGGIISDNGGLPIDLNAEGSDANDALDADGGANEGVNWPVLTSATTGSNGSVRGSLDSLPNTRFEIALYQTDRCDANGGQLQFRQSNKSSTSVMTDANGHADIDVTFGSGFDISTYPYLTALTRFISKPTPFQDAIVVSEVSRSCVAITGGGGAPSPGSVQLEQASYSVSESGGSVEVVVTRTGGSSGAASVNLATADQTALAGSDYTAVSTTLNFADGDAEPKRLAIAISNDSTVEGDENFTVSLGNASGVALGTPASATVTITDDDTATPPPTEPPPSNPPTPVDGGLKAGAGALQPGVMLLLGLLAMLRRARRGLQLLAFALAGVVLPAQAGEFKPVDEPLYLPGLYLGTQLGVGHYGLPRASFERELRDAGHDIEASFDRSTFSGSVYAGLPVYPGLAIEAGWQEFGEYEGELSGSTLDVPRLVDAAAESLRPAGRGVSLGLNNRTALGDWRFNLRLAGVAYRSTQKIRIGELSAENKDSGFGLGGGIGIGYQLGSRLTFSLTADSYSLGGSTAITRLGAQIECRIGR
jgi:hypothetical protein